jgi:hypothetical protein
MIVKKDREDVRLRSHTGVVRTLAGGSLLERRRRASGGDMRFIETDTYREVKDAVEFGLRTREPIIITGPSSVGKTTARHSLSLGWR